jgi:signal peptidase I
MKVLKNIWDNIKVIVITVIITLLFITFVAQTAITIGSSMSPTLNGGDVLVMEKITKRFGGLERFDVVVFNPENGQHDSYIKRIIGLPGEKVRIDEMGNIYIDGEILNENYGKETINDPGNAVTEITLGKNEYFVLGDNRNDSLDSRFSDVGSVNIKQIKGRVMFGLWPIQKVK